MTLQEQVCTREQAQRLEELGCKQNAQICYIDENGLWGLHSYHPLIHIEWDWYSAYTVAELGEMLGERGIWLPTYVSIDGKIAYWHDERIFDIRGITTPFPTEAQARAALLIHILEKEKNHDN